MTPIDCRVLAHGQIYSSSSTYGECRYNEQAPACESVGMAKARESRKFNHPTAKIGLATHMADKPIFNYRIFVKLKNFLCPYNRIIKMLPYASNRGLIIFLYAFFPRSPPLFFIFVMISKYSSHSVSIQ